MKQQLRAYRIPFETEVKFHPSRDWRFDFVLPNRHLNYAIEVDGGTKMVRKGAAVGRHASDGDYEKLNEATKHGWFVFRFTTSMVMSGHAIDFIRTLPGISLLDRLSPAPPHPQKHSAGQLSTDSTEAID